jgi:2-keto-3-deoxy-L-rhamnonate aldolase RhmA
MRNLLKSQLKNGDVTFGVTIGVSSPEVPYALGDVGLDWVNFDLQHTVLDTQTVAGQIQAMSYSNTVPLVRVPSNEPSMINKVLDVGARAVIVPLVDTRKDAEAAVSAAKYSGSRSWAGRAALRDPDYAATADAEIMVIPQIETKLALENIDEIVTVEGISAVFCGPYDLSIALGSFRQFNSEVFQKALELIVSTCEKHNVAPGLLAPIGPVKETVQKGFKLVCIGGDLSLLTERVKDELKLARATAGSRVSGQCQ